MKKGFTLIELLVIMVIVTILVTIALPKYKTAMEKGRALEGIANAASWSEAVNAYYVRNYNSYGCDSESCPAINYANSLKPASLGNRRSRVRASA